MSIERIDKWLSLGNYSRKEAKQILKEHRVNVNGTIIIDPATKIDNQKDIVLLDGEIFPLKRHVYIMLYKPSGIVSASRDPKEKTVVDLVPEHLRRNGLFPAGRLDKDTTGFVLITDDGIFAHHILSPKHHVKKIYYATLSHPLTQTGKEQLEQGLTLKDGTTFLPARVEKLSENEYEIQICEGKYHQIKRMFAAVGSPVLALKRTQIGGVSLDKTLLPGEARELTAYEVEQIANA